MKKLFGGAALLLAVLVGICAVRLWQLPPPTQTGPGIEPIAFDADGAVDRLAASLRIQTVSHEDRARIDPQALAAFAEHLRGSFPRAHRALQREVVGQSLLYTWAGADPASRPILLLAHLDVVPVEPGTEGNWTHPPFGGVVADGFIWGRGARDDKSSVLALLEAVEWLLVQGFQPPRTVYLAFGHDEEIGGQDGALKVAALLKSRGVKAEWLLDEGGAVLDGVVANVTRPVAAIMAAEKGYFTVRLTTRAEGGHSSRPPAQTAVGQLARAVARVQDGPFPARLEPPVTDMLDRLAPEMPFAARLGASNRWLFGPLIKRELAANQTTNPLIRTTTAPTVIHAGIKDNVLPAEAHALINFRLLPGDRRAAVLERLRELIDDPGVDAVEHGGFGNEASVPAPVDNAAFALLARTTREIFPEAVVSTGLVIGATDARNYEGVYETRYNFSPALLRPEDLAAVHGTNERIGIDNYLGMIRFYVQLLRNWAAPA